MRYKRGMYGGAFDPLHIGIKEECTAARSILCTSAI